MIKNCKNCFNNKSKNYLKIYCSVWSTKLRKMGYGDFESLMPSELKCQYYTQRHFKQRKSQPTSKLYGKGADHLIIDDMVTIKKHKPLNDKRSVRISDEPL